MTATHCLPARCPPAITLLVVLYVNQWLISCKYAGVTETERTLAGFCERSFLKLWSYPNPFKDDGHELCDLLAVFGDYVFVFFDRENQLPEVPDKDPQILWDRWKRNVVDRQVKTADGAERYIQSGRPIFLDGKRTTPFPLAIDSRKVIIHKIVVAHGAKEACERASDQNVYGQAIDGFIAVTHGRLDVLFNNAGILRMGANETISLEQQCQTVDINFKGVLIGIQAALPHLKRIANAHIITMGSTSSFYGTPELAVYSATKHAVRALTEALSIELESDGIVVCDIVAPYVNTPMVSAAAQPAHSIASTGINVQPDQVAKTVWRAAHGSRIHWKIHYMTYVTAAVFWIFPFLKRPLVRRLCLSPGTH